MHLLRSSMESCFRNRRKAVLNLMICLVTVLLVNVFMVNIISIKKQIDKLPEVISIQAVVSNLNGSMDSGLKIKEKQIDGILTSDYITDPLFSVQLKAGLGRFGVEGYLRRLNYYVAGSNSYKGIPGLLENEITWEDEISKSEFFSSAKRVCIIDKRLMKEQQLKVGNEITLTTFYYRYGDYHDIYIDPLEQGEFKIVGTMDMLNYIGDGVQPDILVPFETVREIYHQKNIVFLADAGSFTLKDPYELNDFKKEMHDLGFLPVSFQSEFEYDGNALTVKDETFVRSAEQLIKSYNLFVGMLPFLGLAILCIGFVMGQLLMKSRTKEYAIMRSLGQSHKESFRILVMEYGLSASAGAILGIVLGGILLKAPWIISGLSATAFLVCYLIGNMMALASLKKLSIMTALTKND